MTSTMGEKPRLKHELVTELRESLHVNKSELARRVGITRPYLQLIERGARDYRVSGGIVAALARELGTTVERLYGLPTETTDREILVEMRDAYHREIEASQRSELVTIRKLGAIPAGYPLPALDAIEEQVEVKRSELSGVRDMTKLFALDIQGHSLEGEGDDIHDGDTVVVDPDAPFIDGKIYVVVMEGQLVARHVFKEDGHARLAASNGDYREIVASDLDIQGRVIYSFTPGKRH